jgi:cyclic beta-1,2-glucan synthetase
VLACIAIPPLLQVFLGAIPRRRGISKRSHARAVGMDLMLAASHIGLAVTLLAHQAWLMADAIVRTLYRVYVTRRKLLEWVTAAQAKSGLDLNLSSCYRRMSPTVGLAVVVGIVVVFHSPESWPIAAPFVLSWALSPMMAYWISLPPRAAAAQPLSEDDVLTLRLTARRTWRFFETFVGPEDHALPPDNFQEEPTPIVAHRTSGCICSPSSLRMTSGGWARWPPSSGLKRPSVP